MLVPGVGVGLIEREAWSCARQQLSITLPTNVARTLQERVTSGAGAGEGEGEEQSGFLHRTEGYVSAMFDYYEDLGEY